MVGAGTFTLNTSDCTVGGSDNTYGGTSKAITAVGGKTVTDASFVADKILSSGTLGQGVCDNATFGELNWVACGMISLLAGTVQGLDSAVLDAIKINTDDIFNDSGKSKTGDAYFVAWSAFRNISYAGLTVAALVAVISQILGLEIVSAYEFRKLLPRFILIVIVISFLWNLQDFAYNAANDGADAIRALISAPFSKVDVGLGNTFSNGFSLATVIITLIAAGIPAAVAALALLGVGGIAALFASGLLAVGSAWFIVEARNVIAGGLIIISSFAVMSSLFTRKLIDIYLGATTTILLSIPGVAMIMQVGNEMAKLSYINNHAVVAAIILLCTYLLFYTSLKFFDKVTAQLGNGVASATQKARSGLAEYRKNTRKKRTEEAINGQRDIRGARAATNLMRRSRMADKGGLQALLPGRMGRNARATYAGAEASHMQHTAAEMMKHDANRAGGDDDSMELAMQRGMNGNRYRELYAQRRIMRARIAGLEATGLSNEEATDRAQQEFNGMGARRFRAHVASQGGAQAEAVRTADDDASASLGHVQASMRAQMGTGAMRVAAYDSLMKSNTSFADPTGENGRDVLEHMIAAGNSLMADGLMTASDVTTAIKSNGERTDRAGIGHGTLQAQVERSFQRYQEGAARGTGVPAGELVTEREARDMRHEAAFGTKSYMIMGGRHEAISALAPTVRREVAESITNMNTAQDNERAVLAAAGHDVSDDAAFEAAHEAVFTQARAAAASDTPLTQEQQAAMAHEQARDQYVGKLASVAAHLDNVGGSSEQNRELFNANITGHVLPGAPNVRIRNADGTYTTIEHPTISQLLESERTNTLLQQRRREYGNAYAAAAAGQGQPTTPPGG
jgi:hypothetical protein